MSKEARFCPFMRKLTREHWRTAQDRVAESYKDRLVSASARSAWPMRMAAASGWKEREPSEEKKLPDDRRGEECT